MILTYRLHSEAPDLFLHLNDSDLVIFKGDLNHRKLTYDCQTPADTPFAEAIGPMSQGKAAICSLRTIKSDVVVGVNAEQASKLDANEKGWRISGKYAVVLLTGGSKQTHEHLYTPEDKPGAPAKARPHAPVKRR